MEAERQQHGPAVTPGEPEAPVTGTEPAPAPAEAEPAEPASAEPEPAESSEERGSPVAPGEPEAPVAPAEGEPEARSQSEPDDHERLLEHDLEELAAKAEKADEYLELAKRTKADFENYRKRAAREAAAAQERGVAKLAKELLPVVDNLDRAVAAAESANNDGDLVSGIKLVHAGVIAALARMGIEPFSPEGEQFDPQHHEAVAQQPVEGAAPGTVVEVYQRGYRFGESVLRPARVVVAG